LSLTSSKHARSRASHRSGLATLGGHMPAFGVCEGAYVKSPEEEQPEPLT
jgi:hypothetical protein